MECLLQVLKRYIDVKYGIATIIRLPLNNLSKYFIIVECRMLLIIDHLYPIITVQNMTYTLQLHKPKKNIIILLV